MTRTLVIIGAGFSGTLLALHVLRRAPAETHVVLIERGRRFGRGLAFGSGNPNHLLNVPVARMSAFHDKPTDFLDWLHAHPAWGNSTPQCFVSRQAFGTYVRDLLKSELRRPDNASRLILVRGEVQSMQANGGVLSVRLDRARTVAADIAVLATGNFPPEPPRVADPSFYDGPLYRPDPWAPEAVQGLDPATPVLLIGSGLTAVDTVTSLLDLGHTGPITALSRRGLLPLVHVDGAHRSWTSRAAFPSDAIALLRFMRRSAREAAARGEAWQSVVDSLRPFTHDIWQSMPLRDRAAFLRHLRPWWDVHRHRMAPSVARRIAAAQAESQLHVRAGRIQAYHPIGPDHVEVCFRRRHRDGGTMGSVIVGRVINCSGPTSDYARTNDPLLRSILDSQMARPDVLRLGLDVTGTCALREASGAISRQLFAVGPITKAMFWEMTAVPDLRRQCEGLATHLSGLLSGLPPRAASEVPVVT